MGKKIDDGRFDKTCDVCGQLTEWVPSDSPDGFVSICLSCRLTEVDYFRMDGGPFTYPESWKVIGVTRIPPAQPPAADERPAPEECHYYFKKPDGTILRGRIRSAPWSTGSYSSELTPERPGNVRPPVRNYHYWLVDKLPSGTDQHHILEDPTTQS
jgi:hypothetical protein